MTQIDELIVTYEPLLEKSSRQVPDVIEKTALAAVLHSFYNGVEKIFLSIVKELDEDNPEGSHWHRALLLRMTEENTRRKSVISEKLARQLADYL